MHGSESRPTSITGVFAQYAAAVAFVMATGVIAYLISERIQSNGSPALPPDTPLEWRIQLFGWTSAIAYRELGVNAIANGR